MQVVNLVEEDTRFLAVLHGVGASVVNALSEYMEVEVYRDGKIYKQRYERGKAVTGVLETIGDTDKTGTKTTFKPDPEIFEELEFSFEMLVTRFRELAFLNKGLKIMVIDERERRSSRKSSLL